MELKGSRTEQNLLSAFSGESMARNKYLFFAEKAKQENMQKGAAARRRAGGPPVCPAGAGRADAPL